MMWKPAWALHGVEVWMLGPSKDHYQCYLYYVPETTGYCVPGSVDLFLQHCIEPTFTPADVSHNALQKTYPCNPPDAKRTCQCIHCRQFAAPATATIGTKGATKGDRRHRTVLALHPSKGEHASGHSISKQPYSTKETANYQTYSQAQHASQYTRFTTTYHKSQHH